MLYVSGIIKTDTWVLALFVMCGSTMINLFINEEYMLSVDLITHVLPILALEFHARKISRKPHTYHIEPLLATLACYSTYMKFDVKRVMEIYRKPVTAFLNAKSTE